MKKFLSLLLCLCMLASVSAAFAEMPLVTEPETLKIATWRRDGQVDYNDMLMWQKYEALSGVHVEWTHLPNATFTESRNALFIDEAEGGSDVEAIYRAKLSLAEVNKYSSEELLMPLDELIDQYAPNLKKFFDENPSVRKALTMEDGHIYCVGYFNLCSGLTVGSRQFLNMNWMENLKAQGIDAKVPTTIDELTELLRLFKANDANANGDPNDEIPMSAGSIDTVENCFKGAYALQTHGENVDYIDTDKEGNLRFWPASDSYRKLLKQLHDWYTEGLLDENIFTMDTAQNVAQGTANREGLYMAVNLTNVGGDIEPYYAGLPAALIGPDGDQMYTSCDSKIYSPASFVIMDSCSEEHAKLLIQWVDYFYSQEGAELLFLVDEMLYDTDENGVHAYNDYVNKNPDGLTLTQVISQHTCWSGGNCPTLLLDNVFIGGETKPIPLAAAKCMLPYLPEEIWEPVFFTVAQNDEKSPILTDLEQCITEYRGAFITGTKDIDKDWDEFVKALTDMRYPRYLEIVQEAFDAAK